MGWKATKIDGFDNISNFFHLPEGFLFIIGDDKGKIVGCGGVKLLTSSIGLIKRFYITSSLRGSGIAKNLLNELISEAHQRHLSKLVLDVYYKNLRAARFYEKNGFTKYLQEPNANWSESLAPEKFFYYQFDLV